MESKYKSNHLLMQYIRKYNRFITLLSIILLLPVVYLVVFKTGGVRFVYAHTMYIPILLAGIVFGPKIGITTALIAGLLLGPLMPQNTFSDPYIYQSTVNWIYRLSVFVVVGAISGYGSFVLRYNSAKLLDVQNHNQDTQIPNRNYLRHAEHLVLNHNYSLLSIHINNHDNISDVLGSHIYNQLVYQIYQDLKIAFGKHIIIIQPDSNKLWLAIPSNQIDCDCEKVYSIINQERIINGMPLYTEFSVGGTKVYNKQDVLKINHYKNACLAARQAKVSNLHCQMYSEIQLKKRQEYYLLSNFSKALKDNETFLAFQPIVDIKTGVTLGFESLIRGQHKTMGIIPPNDFIPLIEETRLIADLTDWVIEGSLTKLMAFKALGINLTYSINISAKNLSDPSFFIRTKKILDKFDFDKSYITFEITESTLMKNPELSKKIISSFNALGIQFSIDDFGKGHSSLTYLSQFNISSIKIDRYFTSRIHNDNTIKVIVDATIKLANTLGYKITCEGIEDEASSILMTELGCDYGQGYYYCKPLFQDDIIPWYLANQKQTNIKL